MSFLALNLEYAIMCVNENKFWRYLALFFPLCPQT